ncbi:MAG: hypothetical protein H7X77_03310, partial [Anaerolineae bacterium]|nr:hypothetical protein [Anaerolineae bacterium]
MIRIQKISPLVLLLMAVGVTLGLLMLRGLNIAPLHTDIFILRGWFDQFGTNGFADYYFEINQRHPLVGVIYTITYSIFGEQDFYYNLFFQAARLLNGALLGGVIMQLTQRKALALCVGLALMFTPVRLPEAYQQLCWLIEISLTLLLLSLYCFINSNRLRRQSVQQTMPRLLWYLASFLLYVISILIYEAGLPWLAVFIFAGWILRSDQPWKQRAAYLFRDILPFLICALAIVVAIFFVWTVWDMIAPTQGTGSNVVRQFLSLFGTLFQFPQLYVQRLTDTGGDGYYRWIGIAAIGGAGLVSWLVWLMRDQNRDHDPHPTLVSGNNISWLTLLAFGLTML